MTHAEMIKKFEEIAEKYTEEIKAAKSIEEVCKIFVDNGMDAPVEEIKEMIIELAENCGAEGEMTDDEMDKVSGGGLTWGAIGRMAKATWEVGTWVAGKLVYGDQGTAKKKIKKFWGIG